MLEMESQTTGVILELVQILPRTKRERLAVVGQRCTQGPDRLVPGMAAAFLPALLRIAIFQYRRDPIDKYGPVLECRNDVIHATELVAFIPYDDG